VINRIHRIFALLCLLAAGLLGSSIANAHGGEDHGDEGKAPAPAIAVAPRAVAQSDDFELVALLDDGPSKNRRLIITVDRFKTNEPVVGAKLEVEAGAQNIPAQEQSPGVYAVQFAALNSLASGAKLPLTISLETADGADLLTTTLELPASASSGVAHAHGRAEYAVWAAGTVILLAGAIFLVMRRRQFTKRNLS